MQDTFHGKADLARVSRLGRPDLALDGREHGRRKRLPHAAAGRYNEVS
jgi:hypothetical protein